MLNFEAFLFQGMKDKEKHKYPTLTQENKDLADNMADTVIGCMIRGRNSFLNTAKEIVSLNRQWKDQSKYGVFSAEFMLFPTAWG